MPPDTILPPARMPRGDGSGAARMEDAVVHALATLYEANTRRWREERHTLLDVPPAA